MDWVKSLKKHKKEIQEWTKLCQYYGSIHRKPPNKKRQTRKPPKP